MMEGREGGRRRNEGLEREGEREEGEEEEEGVTTVKTSIHSNQFH